MMGKRRFSGAVAEMIERSESSCRALVSKSSA